jgi:hypothetical protein
MQHEAVVPDTDPLSVAADAVGARKRSDVKMRARATGALITLPYGVSE